MTYLDERLRAATVLLAEDNPADQDLARRALEKGVIQCDLHIVSNGEEAMDYLLQRGNFADSAEYPRPDLLLLDLNMPRLDGRQVLQRMKADPDLDTIPVVVLTTSNARPDIESAYDNHAAAFITKPLDMEGFMEIARGTREFWVELVTVA